MEDTSNEKKSGSDEGNYTVNHKKRGTLFLTITTTFLGQFLQFLQQMKQE